MEEEGDRSVDLESWSELLDFNSVSLRQLSFFYNPTLCHLPHRSRAVSITYISIHMKHNIGLQQNKQYACGQFGVFS